MGTIVKFIKWVFEKFAMGILIVVLGLTAGAVWYFLHDPADYEAVRRETIDAATMERVKVQSALDDVRRRLDRLAAEISAEQEKGRQADKVAAQLRELESTWDKIFGDRAQQQANAQRLEDVMKLRAGATARVTALQTDFKRTTWERDGLEIALGRLDTRLQEARAQESKVKHYLEIAWEHLKGWVIGTLVLYFLGPTLGKLGLYFWVAPWVTAGKPVRLRPDLALFPQVAASQVTLNLTLAAGERLCLQERFLQSSSQGLLRKTRFFLDWRLPFSCLISGQFRLAEISHWEQAEGSDLTLTYRKNPHGELAIVTLPEGSAVVLRPSLLAGVVLVAGERVQLRGRWQLFRWQAWLTGQFRFFEFTGPCRLIVAGGRGVQAFELVEGRDNVRPARRMESEVTFGFTPNLEYGPARAETFWSYYRGSQPLFDDHFAGRGVFLCQKTAAGLAHRPRKFSSRIWEAGLKLFGL